MITQFKIFENNKNYIEIDLKELYKNMFTYRKELGFQFNMIQDEFRKTIKKLLTNKHVEFQKVKNRIDGDITYNEEGVVQWVNEVEGNIILKLKNIEETFQLAERVSQVIKIYDSEPLSIMILIDKYEEERRFKNEVDKYNL